MIRKIKFLNCEIDVSKKIFRPRIETEFWVGRALNELKIVNFKLKILDIFAGTGCIGIAVLKACPKVCRRVDFVDISKEAVEQIKINLRSNKIREGRYRIIQSNLFEKLKGRKYDFIFANPPYVALDRISEVQKEVLQKEPRSALFGGKDGIFWIERFLSDVKKYLKPGGKIFMEFDPKQKEGVKKILEKGGFKFQFKKDQFRKYRWLKAGI